MSADRPSCSPVRVRRGADAGTVLDVGTVTDGGRAVLAVLVLVDGAGPGCREWWPAAACEVGPAPRSGWVAFLGADPAELAALGGYVRRYPLPATVAERAGWTVPEAIARATEAGRRILAELRADGVTVGAEEDAEAAAYTIGETDRPPVALVALGLVLVTVVREVNDGDGLTAATAARLEAALAELATSPGGSTTAPRATFNAPALKGRIWPKLPAPPRADPLADRPVLPPVALRAVTRIAAGLGVLVLTADGPGLEALAELADKLTGGGR